MRILIIIILAIGITGISYVAYSKYNNPEIVEKTEINEVKIYTSNKTDFDLEIDQIRAVPKQEKDINSLKYYGWIPDWDMVDGLQTLKENSFITSVSPFWFDINPDGSLKTNLYTNWGELIEYTANNNIMLVPTITAFDRDELTQVLNSPENTDRFINETISYIEQYNYDGIDLDFESFYISDQKLFLELLTKLKERLSQSNKLLYFSILAKWGNNISYAQTRATLNYAFMKDIVDIFVIQGYSYSPTSAKSVGPIGPIDWQEDIIRYAINEGISRDKIVLGVNTYAQDWSDRPVQYDLLYYTAEGLPENDFGAEAAVAYYHDGVDKLHANYSVDENFIESWGEVLGSYGYFGQKRWIVYPNSDSIELRKKLAAEYGINGISYWRLGDEGSLDL